MIHYVKNIDQLVELVDKEFSGKNSVCPLCKKKIGYVNIPNIELGMEEFKFMQFKYPGIYCTEGHCVVQLEEDKIKDNKNIENGSYRVHIEDPGIKVYEVMKLIKTYIDVDKSIPNSVLYWMLLNKENPLYTKKISCSEAYELLDNLQQLGAKALVIL